MALYSFLIKCGCSSHEIMWLYMLRKHISSSLLSAPHHMFSGFPHYKNCKHCHWLKHEIFKKQYIAIDALKEHILLSNFWNNTPLLNTQYEYIVPCSYTKKFYSMLYDTLFELLTALLEYIGSIMIRVQNGRHLSFFLTHEDHQYYCDILNNLRTKP